MRTSRDEAAAAGTMIRSLLVGEVLKKEARNLKKKEKNLKEKKRQARALGEEDSRVGSGGSVDVEAVAGGGGVPR
eukprot:CAMPEP_0171522874 /NCGR_PEP_ID=MMETSP0959-20130129/8054_1 /TAXON_ID=87120 /ORGANISM="Aurantiochytrium limacinum, Strain ATCCMYA-1381" /LENGTH=74 /DNA_ID=CAMNT_0012063183 /DNA_START=2514 /DNA_END=2739 /DNA_ORIENTATION=-